MAMTVRKELEKSVTAGKNMEAFAKTEEFKWFKEYISNEIARELVEKYAYRDETTRKRMEEQMIMISAFNNLVEGTIRKGAIDAEQLISATPEQLDEEIE